VKVELPNADAEVIDTRDQEPLVVSVTAAGEYYVNYGDDKDSPIDAQTLLTRTAALLRQRPGIPVVVRGDKDVPYGRVVYVMTLLQKAGAPSVGLMTDPLEGPRG